MRQYEREGKSIFVAENISSHLLILHCVFFGYTDAYTHAHACMLLCVCVCVCVYIHICICTYKQIDTFIHICK